VPGRAFDWLDAATLVVEDGGDLYAHRLATGARARLLRDASQPRVAR
jgi:hypothetical protein